MTPQCQEWIAFCVKKYPCKGDVLEVGSFDVNGNPRDHFKDRERFQTYTGIDMREGPCVDQVMNTQAMEFPDNAFDVIVDAERMEHDSRFWLTIKELFRVCRPGGHLIVTTRSWGAFPPHDYPSDYWRFMDNGLRDLLEYGGFECLATAYGERWQAGDRAVFAIGRKPITNGKSKDFSIVILSRNAANLVPCVQAIQKNEPDFPMERIVVVDDGARKEAERHLPEEITWVSGSKPFVFARNANIGIAKANSDVILLNDDALLLNKNGLTKLSKCGPGIVSAAIHGLVGNRNQAPQCVGVRPEYKMLCFICVFIPKSVQEKLGPLDERFTGYGFDDDDYSKRAVEAGIPLSVFDGCLVDHSGTPTFRSRDGWVDLMRQNESLFKEKYPSSAQRSSS
jgi:GT2 family glycosyltransferase